MGPEAVALERSAAEWSTLSLATVLVLGNLVCALCTPMLVRRRAVPLSEHPIYPTARIMVTGIPVVALYAAAALDIKWSPLMRVVAAVAWAPLLSSYAALVWQLMWRNATNEYVLKHMSAMQSRFLEGRLARRMRVAYVLSRWWAAELFASFIGVAQVCVTVGAALLGHLDAAMLGVACVWTALGALFVTLLYYHVRTEAVVASRRLVIRTYAVWLISAGVCAVLVAERVDPIVQRAVATLGVVASTVAGVWAMYVESAIELVRRRHSGTPQGATSPWGALMRRIERHRATPVAATDEMLPLNRRNMWARDPPDPAMVTASAWVRMVYADDRTYGAWMTYVHRHARGCVPAAEALRTVALCEAGNATEQACLTSLQLSRAVPEPVLAPLWTHVGTRMGTHASEDGNVFAAESGATVVKYLLRSVQHPMRAFVNDSDELRTVAIEELQQRLARVLVASGDDGADAAPSAASHVLFLGAYPSILSLDAEDMCEVLLYEDAGGGVT